MADQDEWEDVPQKKAGAATVDSEWEDVPTSTPAAKPVSPVKTQFEKARTEGPNRGVISGLGIPEIVKSTARRLAFGGLDPIGDIESIKGLGQTKENIQAGGASAEEAMPIPAMKPAAKAVGSVAGALSPVAGVSPVSQRQRAEHADIGGVVGENIIPTLSAVAPLAHEIPSRFTEPINRGVGAVADKIARGTPITEAGKIAAAKEQALTVKKPTMNETEYAQQVTDALPELQKIAQDNKGKIKTPRQAVQAINDRISQIEAPIADHIAGQTAEHQLIQPNEYQDAVNAAMDKELAKRPGVYKPEEIEKAKKAVNDFIGEDPKTLTEIEGNRRRLNQDADAYHRADTAGKRAIDVSDATATAQRAAANAIRDVLYGDGNTPGKLEKAGVTATDANGNPMSLRDVRRQVGRLLNIRDHFEDAITKAEATGDWKAFKPMFTGPSVAAGGLGAMAGLAAGGPFGALLGTLAGEGVKAWGDYLRTKNPNLNTEKMFRNLANTSAPTNVPQIKTMTPPAPPPVAVQQTLGLPTAAHGPLFNIEQTPRLRPDFEEPRIGTISGQQVPLNIPASPEQAPLFSIPQTERAVPEQPKLSNVPKFEKATAPIEAETSGLPKVKTNFRGTADNVKPATAFRAHDVGNPEVDPRAHAHATESAEEAEKYKEGRGSVRGGRPQTVSQINLSRFAPDDIEIMEGPNGKKWYKFRRQLTKEDYLP